MREAAKEWPLRTNLRAIYFPEDWRKYQNTQIARSCLSPEIISLLNAHCFFDWASSKANSPSLLRFVHQRLKRPPKNFKPTLHSLERFWLGTLACFYYREFKTDNWWVHSSRHFHSSHLKLIKTTSIIRTRTLSNLFAKKNIDSFLQAWITCVACSVAFCLSFILSSMLYLH